MTSTALLSRREWFHALRGQPALPHPAFITPSDDFFQHRGPLPSLQLPYWSLSLGGMVRHPQSFSFNDLQALPVTERTVTIACYTPRRAPQNRPLVSTARWRGLSVEMLLDYLELPITARYARLISASGSVTALPLATLRAGLLAYEMNGQPLSLEQGQPLRLVVPGVYSYKQPLWLTRIEFTDVEPLGRETEQNWPPSGVITPINGILSPQQQASVGGMVSVTGFVYGASEPRLRIDDLAVTPELLTPDNGFETWRLWQYDWQPMLPGQYTLNTGDHRVTVWVEGTAAR